MRKPKRLRQIVERWSLMNDDMFNDYLKCATADDIIKDQATAARITEFADPEVKAIRTKQV